MVRTCSKTGREEIAKRSYEIASTREEGNEVDVNLPGQKGLED
jgi:hypothetical protein